MIKICKVTKTYPNGTTALRDVNIHIKKGEFVFFVGASGAGKSTLAKLLLREELPTKGEILVNGVDIVKLKRRQLPFYRRGIGVVFQDFRLLPEKTVYENVAFAMRVVEEPRREILRQVPAVLHLVGLSHKSRMKPSQLSGGEQQRVALARAIVNNPPLLLADEPTGNLDPDTAWEIVRLLVEINRRGTTVIMGTHAREIVDTMKKRVVALEGGRVVRDDQRGAYGCEEAKAPFVLPEVGEPSGL
ncbi:MAG: cell division ATP-binding protein FtsE [Firmicutes bacterium]|nr:cell division ATP-binding protein FtsE [Bacillota bacterium]